MRFIPTCVGNTVPLVRRPAAWTVHPHVRGEYTRNHLFRARYAGSSPRAWGIRAGDFPDQASVRFIPTCVGNTCWLTPERLAISVHPHVRGEYFHITSFRAPSSGSSPRAWGIHSSCKRMQDMPRFIPTCVGNTSDFFPIDILLTVHPHVRGEYLQRRPHSWATGGSSPRAWGIQRGYIRLWRKTRFIPTCVGNTPTARWSCWASTVHPHVRGEYELHLNSIGRTTGSSPRAWGIRRGARRDARPTRFIPTCVGNTPGCRH